MSEEILQIGYKVIDLGNIQKGDKRKFGVTIFNTYHKPVALENPWAACGCTTPTLLSTVVPANGYATMVIEYDSTGKSGLQQKSFGVNYKHPQTLSPYGLTLNLKTNII